MKDMSDKDKNEERAEEISSCAAVREMAMKLWATGTIKEEAKPRDPDKLAAFVPTIDRCVAVAEACHKYTLDPFVKHVIWYQDQPYITVAGLLAIAQAKEDFDCIQIEVVKGQERVEFLTAMGLIQQYDEKMVGDGQPIKVEYERWENKVKVVYDVKRTVGYCVTKGKLYKKGSDRPTEAYALASLEDIGNFLRRELKNVYGMSRARCIGTLCKLAYGIGLPMAEEATEDDSYEHVEKKSKKISEVLDEPATRKLGGEQET